MTALLVLGAAVAWAGPNSGFSIMGGAAFHSGTRTITEGAIEGQEDDFESSGISWGIDYQFALGSDFSLNIFLQRSSETVEKPDEFDNARHAILGPQLRL